MTEVRGDDQELFRALEAVHMDPGITDVFKKMFVYQELLADSPVSGEYISKIMNELDNDWRRLMGREAFFTGTAHFPTPKNPKGERLKGTYEDAPVFFHGVLPRENEAKNISISVDDPRYYDLYIQLNQFKDGVLLQGLARPEDVMGLDFPDMISFERSRHVLENFQPGMFYSLEESIAKPAEHEGQVVRRLRKYFYDQTEDDPDVERLTTLSLNCYTNHMLGFDRNIGYLVAVKGRGWVESDDTFDIYRFSQMTPAVVTKVVWRESPKKNDSTVVPHLEMQFSTENMNEMTQPVLLPLTSVKDILPLRYAFIQKP